MDTLFSKSSAISIVKKGKTRRMKSISRLKIFSSVVILLMAIGLQKSYGQGVGISETSIVPHASSILELRYTSGSFKGFLAPRLTTVQRTGIVSPADGLLVYDTDFKSFWYYDAGWLSIAASQFGASNQVLGMNAAGTANEYKTLNGTPNQIYLNHSAGNIRFYTPQDIHINAIPTFDGLTLSLLSPNAGVYTDNTSRLTSMPPISGTIGYWSRDDGLDILSPSNVGDDITTTGNIYTTGGGAITSSGLLTGSLGATISGAAINLNNNSDFATNINTGTSTGAVTIGGTGTQAISVGDGAGIKTVSLGSNTITSSTTILSGTGGALTLNTSAGGAVTNIGTGTTSGGINIGSSTNQIYLPEFTNAGLLHNDAAGLVTSSLVSLTIDVNGTLPVFNGGTGLTTFGGTNTVLYTSSADNLTSVATSTAVGQFLQTTTAGGAPTWKTILDVANGGTGRSSITSNNLIYGNDAGAVNLLTPSATTGALLTTTVSGAPDWLTLNTLPSTSGILQSVNGGTGYSTYSGGDLLIGNTAGH